MISWLDGEKDTDHRIYDEIAAHLKRPDQELQWTLASLSITEVASLAVLVLKYASQDEKCMNIIEEAAASLAKQICIVYKKQILKINGRCPGWWLIQKRDIRSESKTICKREPKR